MKNNYSLMKTLYLLIVYAFFINAAQCGVKVPPPEDMIDQEDVIVIGAFTSDGSPEFKIEEQLKSPVLLENSVKVIFPYWELQKDFFTKNVAEPKFKKKIIGERTILLGRWYPDKKELYATCGRFSFWPQGVPKGGEPVGTLQELRTFIIDHLNKSKNSNPVKSKGLQ